MIKHDWSESSQLRVVLLQVPERQQMDSISKGVEKSSRDTETMMKNPRNYKTGNGSVGNEKFTRRGLQRLKTAEGGWQKHRVHPEGPAGGWAPPPSPPPGVWAEARAPAFLRTSPGELLLLARGSCLRTTPPKLPATLHVPTTPLFL